MRFIQYKTSKMAMFHIKKVHYQGLPTERKRMLRKNRVWNALGTICIYTLLIVYVILLGIIIGLIPSSEIAVWKILLIIARCLLGIALLIPMLGVMAVVLSPILKKAAKYHDPANNTEISSLIRCEQRKFYGINEPYLVTKCFDCSNRRFIAHDVCIFVAEDELCIAADLVSRHGSKDLGCYHFYKDEIVLRRLQDENRFVLELKAVDGKEEVVFRLGYRAKSFIEKNFLATKFDK